MHIKKSGNKIFGAHLSAAERKALNIEIKKSVAEYVAKDDNEIEALILLYMHTKYDLSVDELTEFHYDFISSLREFRARYEMTESDEELWLATSKLKEIGLDLEKLNSD